MQCNDVIPINTICNQSLFIRHVRAKRRRPWRGLKLAARGEKDDEDDSDNTDSDDEMRAGNTACGEVYIADSSERDKVRVPSSLFSWS